MKPLNKIPLRLRLTFLTALVLTGICVLLTISSIFNAHHIYAVPAEGQLTPSPLNPAISTPPDAHSIGPFHSETPSNNFTSTSMVYMFIMILLGTVSSYMVAGKALRPVADLSKRIESIDENKLFQQLEGFDTNDEVARLAASFNQLIVKLEKSFNHQKRFAANAAHELRTPLSGMIANIEVLQLDEKPTVQEYKEVLEDAFANAQRMITLVNDLLKLNSAFHADRCVRFNVKEMFHSLISALSESCTLHNIRIDNKLPDIMAFGEQALLQRAFFNLVENAVKYNKRNGEVVVTSAQHDDFDVIIIRDTGIGIPEDELENIFEPLYRVDTSRSRELGGSGLGLSIVKTIIEKHNGNVFIQSEIGSFSEVTVMLPKN
ncbi:sensor histidine kinase [Paenibacillus cellulositrophicus]|uniref:sensor histidine kinase n=1 Tax=Paenibacillus cellulositrophicus TaxID=562959 RepID=UPI0012676662|nr:HAMP domain-containing sensor histidine kinase [Paenibacillus cellulositrophicus]